MSRVLKDLKYERFGLLFVLEQLPERKYGLIQWECICLCGNYKNVIGKYLQGSRVLSCGCLQKERCREFGAMRHAKARFYKVRKEACGQLYWSFHQKKRSDQDGSAPSDRCS